MSQFHAFSGICRTFFTFMVLFGIFFFHYFDLLDLYTVLLLIIFVVIYALFCVKFFFGSDHVGVTKLSFHTSA